MFSPQQNQVYSYYWIICNAKIVTVVDNSLGCKWICTPRSWTPSTHSSCLCLNQLLSLNIDLPFLPSLFFPPHSLACFLPFLKCAEATVHRLDRVVNCNKNNVWSCYMYTGVMIDGRNSVIIDWFMLDHFLLRQIFSCHVLTSIKSS